jgi:DNA replication ATP-dependent helicase Dna2
VSAEKVSPLTGLSLPNQVELIKQLIARGNSILLTSYTHSAVDTICRKLAVQESVHLLRLGSTDRVHSDIQRFTPKPVTSVEELQEQIMLPNVVATTCLSISHALFGKRKFDYCIVDEASQITLPTCLGPLRYADKFILVGDSLQLPPLVKNASAKEGGLDVSLFDLLQKAHPRAVAQLRVQYRMNEDIMKLSNELIYEGKLRCGNEQVRLSSLYLPCREVARTHMHVKKASLCSTRCWMDRVFEESTRALFIDTDSVPGRERRVGETLLENDVEADIVTQISAALCSAGVPLNEVAIITPYRQQLRALVHRLGPAAGGDKIEVLTADKSQGRDKDVVLISLVRSNQAPTADGASSEDAGIGQLLNDVKRINVALTRARKKLIIVGSRSTLSRSKLLLQLWNLMEKNSWTMSLSADELRQHQNLVSTVFAPSVRSATTTPVKRKTSNASQSVILRQKRVLLDVVNELS